jgi:hypothetical protein
MTAYADHEKYPHSPRCGTRRELKFFDTIVLSFVSLNMTSNRSPIRMIVEDEIIAIIRLVPKEGRSEMT